MKYMFFFRGGGPQDSRESSPDKWQRWVEALMEQGIIDTGTPLEESGKIVTQSDVSDYLGTAEDIGGYLIINADSIEHAVEIAKQSPNIRAGGAVEVRPLGAMPQ
jgi:hypothetical protein